MKPTIKIQIIILIMVENGIKLYNCTIYTIIINYSKYTYIVTNINYSKI